MSNDFYTSSILPYSAIIIKICRAYTDTQEDFEDYYQEVCLQIWKSRNNFKGQSEWSTWVYRLSLNVCMTLLKKKKNNHQHSTSDFLTEEETEQVKKDYNISDNSQFPKISRFELIARVIGIKPDEVCKIVRSCPTAITNEYYRICVNKYALQKKTNQTK